MKTNYKRIIDARVGLAKLANTELPAPLLDKLAPTLDAADPVIGEWIKAEAIPEAERDRLENRETEIPACSLPSLPEIRMTYLERKALRGIVDFEEVE